MILPPCSERDAAYVESWGLVCPNCGSHDIFAKTPDFSGPAEINCDVRCFSCKASWEAVYTLNSVANLFVPEDASSD